jgi:hypothetical protein
VGSVPPSVVKSVKDLIFWQYAKIIADSAGIGKKDYGFVTVKFKQLRQGEIFWNEIREYVKEREQKECIFCGAKTNLTVEHLLPRSFNGPDVEKNLVWICKNCNSSKGARRLYEYWAAHAGMEAAKYEVPRIAEGKYLKFAFENLKENGLLETGKSELSKVACTRCDMKTLCTKQGTEGKLTVFCIDGMLTLCFKKNV